MNLELKARFVEANITIVDMNGFKFRLHKMEVETLSDIHVLVPIFVDVSVGDCFVTDNWVLTRLDERENPAELCVRCDSIELVSSDNFEPSKYLNSEVTGLFLNSKEKMGLRTVGADAKAFYSATLRLKDANDVSFSMLLCAFGSKAKALSTVPRRSIIKCTVTVKRRKYEEGYELSLLDFVVKQEGKED